MARGFWTEGEIEVLQRLYPATATKAVAKALGRGISEIYRKATLLGLRKSVEFLASDESGRLRKGEHRGERTQFRPGHIPVNKGVRRPGWGPGRMKHTQFQKGNRTGFAAKNWKPVGTILVDPEGYLRIKVREAVAGEPTGFGNVKVWQLYARHVWEQHYGAIPPRHVVCFRDGDRKHCRIENLELVSRADLARRNSPWFRFPREVAELIQLNGALKRSLRRRDGKEQNQ